MVVEVIINKVTVVAAVTITTNNRVTRITVVVTITTNSNNRVIRTTIGSKVEAVTTITNRVIRIAIPEAITTRTRVTRIGTPGAEGGEAAAVGDSEREVLEEAEAKEGDPRTRKKANAIRVTQIGKKYSSTLDREERKGSPVRFYLVQHIFKSQFKKYSSLTIQLSTCDGTIDSS